MSHQRSVCLLGGPNSGKSTFLGAVSNAIEDGSTRLFRSGTAPSDASGLNRLQDPLLDGVYPQRTQIGEQPELHINLEPMRPLPPDTVALAIADYAGETVERLFRDRTRGWTPAWQARAEADGVLLFIRPPAVQPLPRLRRVGATPGAADAGPARLFGPGLRVEEGPRAPRLGPDDPVRMPTELAVIELLQFLRHVRGLAPAERPPASDWRVGVVISAWDDVSADWRARGPRPYLEQCFPLLEDYLWSNFRPDGVRRFGLSSTGGDLRDDAVKARYSRGDLLGFVTWNDVDGAVRQADDIALPLGWALFGDAAHQVPA